MELTFLGTGAGAPTAERNVQSCVLRLESGEFIVIDCGEGTQQQLLRLGKLRKGTRVKAGSVTRILVTHLHGDHCFGLPGLLCLVDAQSGAAAAPIQVVGPPGLRMMLRVALVLSRTEIKRGYYVTELVGAPSPADLFAEERRRAGDDEEEEPERGSALEVTASQLLATLLLDECNIATHPSELPAVDISMDEEGWSIATTEEYQISAAPVDHGAIPCLCYSIRESDRPGKTLNERVREHCKLRELSGDATRDAFAEVRRAARVGEKSVLLVGGLTIEKLASLTTPGRLVAVMGDCRGGGLRAARLAQGADLVVHEATLGGDLAETARQRGHSTPKVAGAFAVACGARSLALWHFSSRYKPEEEEDSSGNSSWRAEFRKQARQAGGFEGPVHIATDFDSIPIPKRSN